MTPTPEREEALFQAAAQLPGSERAAFLEQECRGKPALRERLESLLAAYDLCDSFMADSTQEFPPAPDSRHSEAPDEAIGMTIGRYKLLEKLGEGGCGVVYVAEQTEPIRRRVALKVVRLGMDTRQVVARFEAERQALAMMDHPNIAKVLDAGATEAGRPYFIMELVRGIRITDYCDQHQLSTLQRLDLFNQVCQAIQHAHQKGIIHRDIKPSNLLVTLHDGVPVPKVIDFGIAKATEGRLTEATVYTQLHQFIGTPAYMSPEQAEMSGLDIDTRSDIYSLGVLLYELLTGKTPFEGKALIAGGLDAMRRTIRETDPVRPSTRLASLSGEELTTTAKRRGAEAPKLMHLVRGDLDWIVMKCLEKDRARRYETANGLLADLRRHLNSEPVVARPPSSLYRFQKAFRRNRILFASGAFALMAMLAGIGVSSWQAIRATHAQEAERRQAAQARADRRRAVQAEADARAQALTARRAAYVAEMNVAFQALQGNALERARALLERQRPKPGEEDLRGFEWRHLWQACQSDELATFRDGRADAAAYSPDGLFLACGGKKIVVRDSRSRRIIATLQSEVATLSFSPDSTLLAGANASGVNIWDTGSWQLVKQPPNAHTFGWFSPDGRWFLSGIEGGCRVWDPRTWLPVGDLPGAPPLRSHGRYGHTFSPDGQYVVTIAGDTWPAGDHFRVWRLPGLERLHDLRPSAAQPASAAFTPDGKFLVTGLWDGQVLVWDLSTGKVLSSRTGHFGWVSVVAMAPNGKTFATASMDRTVLIWDAASFEVTGKRRGHTGETYSLAISPDGRELASGSQDGTTKVWSAVEERIREGPGEGSLVAGFANGGRKLVSFLTNSLCLTSPETGERGEFPIAASPVPILEGNWGRPARVVPDGSLVARGCMDGTVEFWSLTNGTRVAVWQAHTNGIASVAFSGDGQQLVTGTGDGEMKIWDVPTRRELRRFAPVGGLYIMAFSPDSQFLAAACSGKGLWLYQLQTGAATQLDRPESDEVMAVAFSPDSQLLASSRMRSNSVHLWEMPSGRQLSILGGHVSSINSIAISPDGKTLASASTDRRIKLWSLTTFQELATIPVAHPIPLVDFSPNGRMLAVSDLSAVGRRVQILLAPTFEEISAAEASEAKSAGQ